MNARSKIDEKSVSASKRILRRALAQALDEVEYLILATPTGRERNFLTDVNIHLMSAESKMKEVK